MFVQGDKQSDPAALEHQQMNSDEVRVNIRHVPMAEMMDVEKTHARTRAHTRRFCSKGGQALAPAGASTAWKQRQQCFGKAGVLRFEQWKHWLLTGFQPV